MMLPLVSMMTTTTTILPSSESTNDKVFSILFESDDISWKKIIFGLIQENQMDPWDLDISIIAHKFLSLLKELKSMDFRVSGKIVLASAILLKMKSDKLMDEEIAALENLIASSEEPFELLEEFPLEYPDEEFSAQQEKPKLVPKTPQPRKRKVSVYDLLEALEGALETDVRRPTKTKGMYKEVKVPKNHQDISETIKEVYKRINEHYSASKEQLTFADILPSEEKQDKVLTFIPLLHLDNQRKVDVLQESHFGEIGITLLEQDIDLEEVASIAKAAKS